MQAALQLYLSCPILQGRSTSETPQASRTNTRDRSLPCQTFSPQQPSSNPRHNPKYKLYIIPVTDDLGARFRTEDHVTYTDEGKEPGCVLDIPFSEASAGMHLSLPKKLDFYMRQMLFGVLDCKSCRHHKAPMPILCTAEG